MPPTLALFLWFVLLVALLYLDPAKNPRVSAAVWIPITWLFILGSRLPSQWLGGAAGQAAQALEEGNPVDRTISLALIVLAVGVLFARSFRWGDFLTRNLALTVFLGYALLSVVWSDFPFVAFKRWFRDLGNYLMILVVLSDQLPLDAVRTLLRRLSYLLIPLSVLLVKYFPEMAKQYDSWSGIATFAGATTSKNMLGVTCLISGLYFFWDTVTRWSRRKERRTKRILIVNLAFIAMTLWLLSLSSSATSRVCLALGCFVIIAARTEISQRHPAFLKFVIPASFCLYMILAFGFGMSGDMAGAIGKDPTLTDRTKIWTFVLKMHTNPLLGTGYESFWMGPRLTWFWEEAGLGTINEAHNGFLEVYLQLGAIGVLLLSGFLIASYRNVCRRFKDSSPEVSFSMAVWIVLLFYSVTEAGFRSNLVWVVFLLGAVTVPRTRRQGNAQNQRVPAEQVQGISATSPFETTGRIHI